LLAIASDTAEVGKKRWITPRSHYKVSLCYEILDEVESAKYHLKQIREEDNERAYERAQERLNNGIMREIDISLIMAENLRECNDFDLALESYNNIVVQYENSSDPYIQEQLRKIEYWKAEIYFYQKDYKKAINSFKQIIDNGKENDEWIIGWSYFYLGNSYKVIKNYNAAREAYDLAEDTDDDWLLVRIEDERKDLPGE
jgi:tetratricopeptide (TPR) repeat protein